MSRRVVVAVAGYVAVIVAANMSLRLWGIVPVGFGLAAPAGVWFAGASLGLRDMVDDLGGRRAVAVAIAVGTATSALVDPTFAAASGAAFAVSELADWAVYRPLRARHWMAAVIASGVVGATVDSLLFMRLAFGSTAGWVGLTVAKLYAVPLGLLAVKAARR